MTPFVYKGSLIRVVDGDTIDLKIDLGFCISVDKRFRIYGINAPEIYGVKKDSAEHEAGLVAKHLAEEWFTLNKNECFIKSIDGKAISTGKYGRWIARIYPTNGTETLSTYLISRGAAVIYGSPAIWQTS